MLAFLDSHSLPHCVSELHHVIINETLLESVNLAEHWPPPTQELRIHQMASWVSSWPYLFVPIPLVDPPVYFEVYFLCPVKL